ncbi:MAG: alpha/beta fold hydrolase [Chloroflexota bacterium]
MTGIRRCEVRVGGQTVRYEVAGKGEPVILVHGLSGSTRWWRNTVPDLERSYRVYTIDLPGFGSMRRLGKVFVLREAADWLLNWMRTIGIERAHMVGHSMGGYVCLMLAALHPEAVDRLVLVDLAGLPTGRSMMGHVVPLAHDVILSNHSFLPVLVFDALRSGPRILWRTARDLLQEDVRTQLQHLVSPTLIVWGEKDVLMPPSAGVILREEIAHSRLVVIQDARHVPMFDKPREFNEIVLRFLASEEVGD